MWLPSSPVGKVLSVTVQANSSGVELPTSLNAACDKALLQKNGVPFESQPLESSPPAKVADQSDVPPGAPIRVALLQPVMLGDTAIKNPESVPPTKPDESIVRVMV
jgi:hypothetical protein